MTGQSHKGSRNDGRRRLARGDADRTEGRGSGRRQPKLPARPTNRRLVKDAVYGCAASGSIISLIVLIPFDAFVITLATEDRIMYRAVFFLSCDRIFQAFEYDIRQLACPATAWMAAIP